MSLCNSTDAVASTVVVTPIDHTVGYYEDNIRKCFRDGKWEQGKRLIDEAWASYGSFGTMCEMAGWYWVHKGKWDKARYYLMRALKDDETNVHARYLIIKVEEQTHHWSSAISFINQQLEVQPYDKNLWLRKIACYRKLKNDKEADMLLDRLYRIYPNDELISKDKSYRDEQDLYNKLKGSTSERENALRRLIEIYPDNSEYYLSLCNLLLQMGRTDEAASVAGTAVTRFKGNMSFIRKKIGIHVEQGKIQEALSYARTCRQLYHLKEIDKLISELEEDAAGIAYNQDPYVMYGRLYERTGKIEHLQMLLNMSMSRNYLDDALFYVKEMRKKQGDTEPLLYREYTIQKRLGNDRQAEKLMLQIYNLNPENEEAALYMAKIEKLRRDSLIQAQELKAHRDSAAKVVWQYEEARRLYGIHEYEDALEMIDSALVFNPKDMDMRELRDIIKNKIYDLSLVNDVYVEYQQARQGKTDQITANATIQYTHHGERDSWTGGLSYAGRDTSLDPDDLSSGGVGVQGMIGLERRINDTLTVKGELSLANKYFPTVMIRASASWLRGNDWTLGLHGSFRLIDHKGLLIAGCSAQKDIDQFKIDASIDLYLLYQKIRYVMNIDTITVTDPSDPKNQWQEIISQNYSRKYLNPYFNFNTRAKFYPVEGNRSHIYASASIGNAPLADLLDRALPASFDHFSTSVGFGGTWTLLPNLWIGVSGTWFTYYIKDYRNYFYTNIYATIRF